MTRPTTCGFAVCLAAALLAPPMRAQINTLTKEQMIEYTAQNPFERFPDGRPKVPDSIHRAGQGLVGRRGVERASGQGLPQSV